MSTVTQEWTEELAAATAREHGIPELTDKHWQVVRFMRERYAATGESPSVRRSSRR